MVSVSVFVLVAESLNVRFLKALRVLRAARPLRVLTRSQSMLMVFHTLVRSLSQMGHVTGQRGAAGPRRALAAQRTSLLIAC